MNGYQIIEPEIFEKLIQSEVSDEIKKIILNWFSKRLKEELFTNDGNIEVAVIEVEYMGKYPAIGVRFIEGNPVDVEDKIISKCNELMLGSSFKDFFEDITSR